MFQKWAVAAFHQFYVANKRERDWFLYSIIVLLLHRCRTHSLTIDAHTHSHTKAHIHLEFMLFSQFNQTKQTDRRNNNFQKHKKKNEEKQQQKCTRNFGCRFFVINTLQIKRWMAILLGSQQQIMTTVNCICLFVEKQKNTKCLTDMASGCGTQKWEHGNCRLPNRVCSLSHWSFLSIFIQDFVTNLIKWTSFWWTKNHEFGKDELCNERVAVRWEWKGQIDIFNPFM